MRGYCPPDAPVWVRRLASGLNPPVDLTGWIHPGVAVRPHRGPLILTWPASWGSL